MGKFLDRCGPLRAFLPVAVLAVPALSYGGIMLSNATPARFVYKISSVNTCAIKGNISHNKGEKIYHLPHQAYYEETVISAGKGERYFCTEAEAVAAGWRRSKV